MYILSNQWPQKSRLLPHVNKNDFCSLFSVKIYFFLIRVDERKGLPLRSKRKLFEIPSRYLDYPLQSLGTNVTPWRH